MPRSRRYISHVFDSGSCFCSSSASVKKNAITPTPSKSFPKAKHICQKHCQHQGWLALCQAFEAVIFSQALVFTIIMSRFIPVLLVPFEFTARNTKLWVSSPFIKSYLVSTLLTFAEWCDGCKNEPNTGPALQKHSLVLIHHILKYQLWSRLQTNVYVGLSIQE